MAAQGQGGAGHSALLPGSFVGPSGTEGEAGWRTALMRGVWAVLWRSEQGERGMEGMAAPSQAKDPSDHSYSLLRAANWFFCCHGLVLFTLT